MTNNNKWNFQEVAALVYKPNEQFTNRLIYSIYNIDRIYNTYDDGQDEYKGDRKALTYSGNYNIDLDSSVVFGFDTEFDQIDYNKDLLTSIFVRRAFKQVLLILIIKKDLLRIFMEH